MAERRPCSVVDDGRVLRAAARRTLEGFGFAVREAGHGAEALEACRASMPEFVPLDWNMPVMDGLGSPRAARAESGTESPVAVVRTTESGLERMVEALRAGAQEYIMKPCDEAILRNKPAQAGLLSAGASS